MKAMSSYIDDTYVNKDMVSADDVKMKLESFGLTCKDPERLKHEAKGLGKWDTLHWKQETAIPESPAEMTRRSMFSICGKLVGHFAAGYVS